MIRQGLHNKYYIEEQHFEFTSFTPHDIKVDATRLSRNKTITRQDWHATRLSRGKTVTRQDCHATRLSRQNTHPVILSV